MVHLCIRFMLYIHTPLKICFNDLLILLNISNKCKPRFGHVHKSVSHHIKHFIKVVSLDVIVRLGTNSKKSITFKIRRCFGPPNLGVKEQICAYTIFINGPLGC